MKKIKETEFMELSVSAGGTLTSHDGKGLAHASSVKCILIGRMVGIKFNVREGKILFYEIFGRSDKISANDSRAVPSIVASCFGKDSENSLHNFLWRWFSKLNFRIYETTNALRFGKIIVLDIGSGPGQSSEAYDTMKRCSFTLVEPNGKSFQSLIDSLE